MNIDPLVKEVLLSGADDWVGIWELPYLARAALGGVGTDAARVAVMEVIRALLSQGLMEVGDVNECGFVRWETELDDAIRRIEREWTLLRREPSLGEIGWLNITAKGEDLARCVSESYC